MKKRVLVSVFMLMVIMGFSQIDKMREKLDDAMVEEDQGLLSLRFFDAETGAAIAGVRVVIEKIGDFQTNNDGIVRFPAPKNDGHYGVNCSKDGYIQSKFSVEVIVGTLFYNRFSMSKKMPVGHLRVVLDWDAKPKDLDAHLIKEGEYHISYQNKKISSDGMAILDRDDLDGLGPETITIKNVDKNKKYRFYVHNYSHKDKRKSDKLSDSKANIKIYGDHELLHQISIPQNTIGLYWHVFEINHGMIDIINSIDQTDR